MLCPKCGQLESFQSGDLKESVECNDNFETCQTIIWEGTFHFVIGGNSCLSKHLIK